MFRAEGRSLESLGLALSIKSRILHKCFLNDGTEDLQQPHEAVKLLVYYEDGSVGLAVFLGVVSKTCYEVLTLEFHWLMAHGTL